MESSGKLNFVEVAGETFDGRGHIGSASLLSYSTAMSLKSALMMIPGARPLARSVRTRLNWVKFKGSADYWEQRYRQGGNSGGGSYDRLARFKADFLNGFVAQHAIQTVIEFGSGDGSQLELATYPAYVGVDVSRTIVDATRKRFADKPTFQFLHASELPTDPRAELSLSLDVIYHLVEDNAFETYMQQVFEAASRFVIIYSSNYDGPQQEPHVRHREFTKWVARCRPDFSLTQHVPNAFPFDEQDPNGTSRADFFVFERTH